MADVVTDRKSEIEAVCRRLGVRRFELFGSAAEARTAARATWIFLSISGKFLRHKYAEAYFSLRETLKSLFDMPVDLVTVPSVSNRYFREGIDRSRRLLYAA
jgi:predicted nucleotidyltransferase